MEYIGLGRTGLRVSVAGLGCGGFSRLGLGRGKGEAEAVALIHQALDLGVNLFDTAAAYGTEAVLGKALEAVRREEIVIATKAPFNVSSPNSSAASAVASLDNSLRQLATDYIDVYQLHGVAPAGYDHARNVIAPALLKEKANGKFRHLGITETAPHDPEHKMLQRAVADGVWDVAMVGFHMMHQNARKAVLPLTRQYWGRDIADVRGAQHLFPPGPVGGDDARAGGRGRSPAMARRDRGSARLSDLSGRCAERHRRRLSLRAARARSRCRAVRNRRSRAPAHQHRLAARSAIAGNGPRPPREPLWPFGRGRVGCAASGAQHPRLMSRM